MSTSAIRIPQPAVRPELVSIFENDISEVAGFISTQSGHPEATVGRHLNWFLLQNPACQPKAPLGFGLRSSGTLVGCILCSPQTFCFENKKILLMGSSSFYVDEKYRGHGGLVFLQYSRLGRQWPLFGTSANAQAAALWKAAGAAPIPGSEGELFGVLRWPPVVEEFLYRRNHKFFRFANSAVSNLAGRFLPLKLEFDCSTTLQPLTCAEQTNELLLSRPAGKLTAMRDLSYIRWRYFSGHDETVDVFAFRSNQIERDVFVTVNRRVRGYRGQMNVLNILDVYPEVPAKIWLQIVAALLERYKKQVDAVVLRSLRPALRQIFLQHGFRPRLFEAPNGWFLDKAKLLPTRDWYAVPADGDGLI